MKRKSYLMEKDLFREKSLEKLSSPNQLNTYLRVLTPGFWLVLAAFIIMLLAAGAWSFMGVIPNTLHLEGIAFPHEEEDLAFYFYVPLNVSLRLAEGMDIQISPDYAPREEYGYIYAKIQSIGTEPVSEKELEQTFENLQYLIGLLPQGVFVEVIAFMEKEEQDLRWSNPKGSEITLKKGAHCAGLVILQERRPYQLILR